MTVKNKKARFLSAILCLALALGLLAGCGSTEAKQPEMSEVVAAVEAVVPTDGMTELDANYLKNVFKLDESQYADCCVMTTNVGTTIDEFGIFKGKDSAQAAELKAAVEEYLQFRLDSWMPEYLPEEFPEAPGRTALEPGRLRHVRYPRRRRQDRRGRRLYRLLRGLI